MARSLTSSAKFTPTGLDQEIGIGPSLAARIKTVANHAALEAIVPSSGAPTFYCTGHTTAGDGGEGLWRWVAGNSDTANGGTILGSNAAGRWKRAIGGLISAKQFGAKGDGVTDDLVSLLACSDYCAVHGYDMALPPGIYRITGTWFIGPEHEDLTPVEDFINGSWSLDADVANDSKSLHRTTVYGLGAVSIWGDFDPGNDYAAVVYYAIPNFTAGATQPHIMDGGLQGVTILGKAGFNSGTGSSVFSQNTRTTYKQVGLVSHSCHGAAFERLGFTRLHYGLVSTDDYWTHFKNLHAVDCVECVLLNRPNAAIFTNIMMNHADVGLRLRGSDATLIEGVHTQQVIEDLVIERSGTTRIGPCYLEDTKDDDGTGKYAITLGLTEDGADCLSTTFTQVRCGAARPNKGAIRIWGTRNAVFQNCRLFSKTIATDAASYGTQMGCDWAQLNGNWNDL